MTEEQKKEYNIKYALFEQNRMSESSWNRYCSKLLEQLLQENKYALDRLKNSD